MKSLPHSHPSLRRWEPDPRALLKYRLIQERLPPPYAPMLVQGRCSFATLRQGRLVPLYEFEDHMSVYQPLIAEVARQRLLAQALRQIQQSVERQTAE